MLPVPEKVYRRLSMLQIKMVHGIPHDAGLNPKAFRYPMFFVVVSCSPVVSRTSSSVVLFECMLPHLGVTSGPIAIVIVTSKLFHIEG